MKTKFLYVIIPLLVLICSCDLSFGDIDPNSKGISFQIFNNTNTEFTNVRFYVGGLKEGNFVVSDSSEVISNFALIRGSSYFIGDEKWKPNLEVLRDMELYDVYFMLGLSTERKEIMQNYDEENLKFDISDYDKFKNENSLVRVYIQEENIIGEFAFEE